LEYFILKGKRVAIDTNIKEQIEANADFLNPNHNSNLNDVSTFIHQLNNFIDGKLELSVKGIEERLDLLIGYYTLTLDFPQPKGIKILRARKFEEGSRDNNPYFKKVDQLSYPPSKFSSLGRCNKKGESVFYGCLYTDEIKGGINVAFSEINALESERINILKSISTDTINLRYIGIYNHIFRDLKPYFLNDGVWEDLKAVDAYMKKKFEEDIFLAYQLCDAFFADILRRKGSEKLYYVTSVLSAMYLESGKADGILYTSVKSEGSPVVALSICAVHSKIKYVKTESFEIVKSYGYAKYRAKKLYDGEIEKSYNIKWTPVQNGLI